MTNVNSTISFDFLNESTTAAPKNIEIYVDIPSWFNGAFLVFNYVIAILQFVAIAINVVHMIILTRKEMRSNAIYRLMIGICIFDLISEVLSFISFSPFWIRETKTGEECYVTTTYQDALIMKYGLGTLDTTQRSSTWLGLFMVLYRLVAITFPMSSKVQNASKPLFVPVVVIVALLLNGLVSCSVYWHHVIQRQRTDFDCDGVQHYLPANETRYLNIVTTETIDLYAKLTFIYGIIKALPSLIEPILAVLLIIEFRRASKRRKNLSKSDDKKSDNATKLILFMTFSSFLMEVPSGFAHFAAGDFEDRLIGTIAYLIMAFSEIFPFVNSLSHFFVCFFMSAQYRETARFLFGMSSRKVTTVEGCRTNIQANSMSKIF